MKVICFLFDPNVGGPTIRARAVYEQMMAAGDDIRIAIPDMEGSAAAFLAERGIPVDKLPIVKPVLPRKVVPFLKFALTAPISLIKLRAYLRRERPDVIHVNGAFDVIPALAGRLVGVPVVWHLNDTVFGTGLSRALGKLVKRIANVIVIAATRVGRHYDVMDADPHVIFAPVDVDRFQPATHPLHTPPKVTLIGNWNWVKGQGRFVEMIDHLRRQGIPIQGEVVGKFLESQTDFWQPILADIKARDLSDYIATPGFKSNMVAVLEDTDLFVLTSHSEASPISLLEAMAMGVPCACFDVGGVAEIMGTDGDDPAGIVVPEGDVPALANAVVQILTNPEIYDQFRVAGRYRVVTKFSLDACVRRHKLAYAAASSTKEKIST